MTIWSALRPHRRTLTAAVLLYMLWQACESLVPVVIGAVIDQAITPGDTSAIIVWIAVLAGLFLVLAMSFRFASRLGRDATERTEHELRVKVAATVLDPRVRLDPPPRTGELLSIATSDAKRLAAFGHVAARTFGAIVSILIVAVALLRISLPLGGLVLIAAPPLLYAMHRLGIPLERRSSAEQEHAAEAANLATDLIGGLRVLKGIGGERAAAARYHGASQRSLHATVRAARAESIYQATTLLLTMCFLALVALVGGRFAAEGEISVGDLVAAVGLAQFLLGPLSGLATVGTAVARARASGERLGNVLSATRRPAATGQLPEQLSGAAHLRSGDISFDVRPGELLGVVAPAEEAAHIVELLAGTAALDGEQVWVDGVPIATVDEDDARRGLLVARHDAPLFAESVLDNIRSAARDEERISAALRASDTDQVIETLPDGGATILRERGSSLSGGQRQRVALARALAADPAVLVLHDPTTAVDVATEARIAESLRAARQSGTTVLVTTSPALLAVCDRIVFLRGGQIAGEGAHHVLSTDPDYRDLVHS